MEGALNTWIWFLLHKTELEGAVQMPIGMVLMAPTLTWLKEDILKCILKGWKVLRASCFTDLLLAAIPANVNTGFAVTLLDLGNLLPSFYLCSYRCDFEELWALWSEQVHCVNLGLTSYQPRNIRVIWRGKRVLVNQHLSLLCAQCCLEMLEQHKSVFLAF